MLLPTTVHHTAPEWKEQEAEVMKFKREPSAEELPKGHEDEDTKKAKGRSPEGKSRSRKISTKEESSSGSDGSSRRSSESEKEANKGEKKVKKRPSKNRMKDASSEDNSNSECSRS
jgi:hypothetical protein